MSMKDLTIGLFILLTGCVSADHQSLYDDKPGFYSYVLGDVNDDEPVMQHAAAAYVNVASCQKTVTALLALKSLSADYQFQTQLFIRKVAGKVHDAVIKFVGDPTLTSAQLITLLEPLRNTTFKGHLILDASLFQVPEHSFNLMLDDIGTYYAPPMSSMILDGDLIYLTLTPGTIKAPVHVSNDVDFTIDNKLLTTDQESSFKIFWENNRIVIKGTVRYASEPQTLKITPQYSHDYMILKIQKIMEALNIKAAVKIINDSQKIPRDIILVNTVSSKPLKDILPPALAISNNVVFDSLYLTIVDKHSDIAIHDWNQGDKIYKELIQQYFKIDMDKANFVDGSGLSRYNRIQPRQLWTILKQGYALGDFVESMPYPGQPRSTVKKRLDLDQSLRVKTGSMSGISCLCGYSNKITNPKVFVIITNSFAPPASEIHTVMDKFIMSKLRE